MMNTPMLRVGVREFRTHLPQYMMASSPITITRHGETIGFYIPTAHSSVQAELEALKKATLKLEKLLATHGVTEDELLSDFRSLREGKDK